ncbi:hypothetical protein BJD99_20475 [Rhodococcus sp. 1163]|uniref:ribonuclease H family protein n=1 Tax=Rhodococcus sp. 1163 TaxID=1905289 RepID=UPI000A02F09D|nr:ribonuclease H family protein [Rhodococcus sp. 1163]ORI19054.1 hypothetical protein BJD99_20475 [Rhodococcus sp. 1163]
MFTPQPTEEDSMLAALHMRQIGFGDQGSVEVALVWSLDGSDSHSEVFTGDAAPFMYSAALEALEHFVTLAHPSAVLYISDRTFRHEIQAAAASFPGLTVVDAARGSLLDLIGMAVAALDDHNRFAHHRAWRAELDRRAALPELVVATDASKGSGRRGVGVACVSGEGGYSSKSYPQTDTVLVGELLAIALAFKAFPDRRLHILTDSKVALSCLAMTRPRLLDKHSGNTIAIVDVIRKRAAHREIRYSWVRGHSGHELNEIADRLAVAARRHEEARVDPSIRKEINRNILEQMSLAAQAA